MFLCPVLTELALQILFSLVKFYLCNNYSLNELPIDKTDGELSLPPSPPPKMSLRNRIGSRLAAAKNSKESRKNEKVVKNEKVEKVPFIYISSS